MIHVDPSHPAFKRLPRKDQALIYSKLGLAKKQIAHELEAHITTVEMWLNPERWERRLAWKRETYKTPEHKQNYNEWRRNYRAAARQTQREEGQ
jgi:hypothetical protein